MAIEAEDADEVSRDTKPAEEQPSEKKVVRGRKTMDKLRQQYDLDAIKTVLNTYEGRYIFWQILSVCKFYGSTFAGEAPLTMARLEGRRSIGGELLDWLFTVDDTGKCYTLMRQEAQKRAETFATGKVS